MNKWCRSNSNSSNICERHLEINKSLSAMFIECWLWIWMACSEVYMLLAARLTTEECWEHEQRCRLHADGCWSWRPFCYALHGKGLWDWSWTRWKQVSEASFLSFDVGGNWSQRLWAVVWFHWCNKTVFSHQFLLYSAVLECNFGTGLFVRPSVCPSHASTMWILMPIGSCCFHEWVA